MALVRYIAAGEANIGFLGIERSEIHRVAESQGRGEGRVDQVMHPPQEDLDEREEKEWISDYAWDYSN